MNIYGFFHLYYTDSLNGILIRWCQLFEEVFHSIQLSGLLSETKLLTICVTGLNENHKHAQILRNKISGYVNVQIEFYENALEYEFPTLQKLWEVCRNENCYVYYCHSKGASYSSVNIRKLLRAEHWRKKMLLTTIVNWKACLGYLKNGFLSCGYQIDKKKNVRNAYAGNFFWASSEHIKKLPFPKFQNSRYDAEQWIRKRESSFVDLHLDKATESK